MPRHSAPGSPWRTRSRCQSTTWDLHNARSQTQVVLLGVCCSPGGGGGLAAPSAAAPGGGSIGGGGGDQLEQVTLQPLPMYAVPSDSVTMTCVASTPGGRVFLGGADGHVHELLYSAGDSWRQRRCSKVGGQAAALSFTTHTHTHRLPSSPSGFEPLTQVCLTGGLRQMLPPFLPALLFGQPQAVVQLEVDAQRNALYALSQASAIQARQALFYSFSRVGSCMIHP